MVVHSKTVFVPFQLASRLAWSDTQRKNIENLQTEKGVPITLTVNSYRAEFDMQDAYDWSLSIGVFCFDKSRDETCFRIWEKEDAINQGEKALEGYLK
jgi:hypothetical protein